jgi:hypothetical protein
MVKLFVSVNRPDCGDGAGVCRLKLSDLLLQVTEHYAFNCHGSSGYGLTPTKPRYHSKREATDCAQVVTAAAWSTATCELGQEDCAMPALMLSEVD